MAVEGSHKATAQLLEKRDVEKDVFRLFTEKLRDHKGLVSKWGILQETHLTYFRGKDFVSLLKTHPELKDVLPETDRSLTVEGIANVLLRKHLLVRCDRVVKTVRPGKNLPTWPKHLEIYSNQVFSETDAFFAWTFVKPQPLWQKILWFLWPVLVILALCLFPQFRHQCKQLVLYSSVGILLPILGLLLFGVLLIQWLINYCDAREVATRTRLQEDINKSTTKSNEAIATGEEEALKTLPDHGMDGDKSINEHDKEEQVIHKQEEVVHHNDQSSGHHEFHKRGLGPRNAKEYIGRY